MNAQDKQVFIQRKAIENQNDPTDERIYWSRHAITEAVKDNLTRQDVEAALVEAELIENYPVVHRPLPDCLVLCFLSDKRPFHAVVAIDVENARIFMITVYLPANFSFP